MIGTREERQREQNQWSTLWLSNFRGWEQPISSQATWKGCRAPWHGTKGVSLFLAVKRKDWANQEHCQYPPVRKPHAVHRRHISLLCHDFVQVTILDLQGFLMAAVLCHKHLVRGLHQLENVLLQDSSWCLESSLRISFGRWRSSESSVCSCHTLETKIGLGPPLRRVNFMCGWVGGGGGGGAAPLGPSTSPSIGWGFLWRSTLLPLVASSLA